MRLKKNAIRLALGIIGAIMIMAVVSVSTGFGPGSTNNVEAAKPAQAGGPDRDGGGLRWSGF